MQSTKNLAAKLILISQVMSHTCDSYGICLNDTQLMMKMTHGFGCAENESFLEYPRYAICCEGNYPKGQQLAPNVCLHRPSTGNKILVGPGCACNTGGDLIFISKSSCASDRLEVLVYQISRQISD